MYLFKRFISRDEKKLNFTYYFEMLENFLKKNEYEYVRPKDFSVFFETKYTRYKDSVANFFALNIDHIKPFLIDEWKNISQFIYFTGKQIDNKKVFIKYSNDRSAFQHNQKGSRLIWYHLFQDLLKYCKFSHQ